MINFSIGYSFSDNHSANVNCNAGYATVPVITSSLTHIIKVSPMSALFCWMHHLALKFEKYATKRFQKHTGIEIQHQQGRV